MTVARGWRRTIRLKDLLSDDDSSDGARRAAAGFAKRLARLPESRTDDELADLIAQFDDIATSNGDDLCDEFNEVLDCFYDWADDHRVWISGVRQ